MVEKFNFLTFLLVTTVGEVRHFLDEVHQKNGRSVISENFSNISLLVFEKVTDEYLFYKSFNNNNYRPEVNFEKCRSGTNFG